MKAVRKICFSVGEATYRKISQFCLDHHVPRGRFLLDVVCGFFDGKLPQFKSAGANKPKGKPAAK